METITKSPLPLPVLLTLDEVADVLRCTRRTVERVIAAGNLEVLRVGRCVRVETTALDRYLESVRSGGG